jgi:hypothetical protein
MKIGNSPKLAIRHSAPSGPQSATWPKKTFAAISTVLFDCRTVVRQEQGSNFGGTAKMDSRLYYLDR